MSFSIALVQHHPVLHHPEKNIRHLKKIIDNLQADLLVMPELANTGYLYESPDSLFPFAESVHQPGAFLTFLHEQSLKTEGVIVAGYAEKEDQHLYNSAVAISPEGILANYRKTHLYADEKKLFQPGDSGFSTFQWKSVSIGIMICFDWIFPESARTLALAGAQIIAHPANLVMPYCQAAMVTRSIENQVFTITANRIGQEKTKRQSLNFTGRSQMTDPKGRQIFQAASDEICLHRCEIDPTQANNKHISKNNNLFEDRRPSLYQL